MRYAVVAEKLWRAAVRHLLPGVRRGGDESSRCQVGKHFRREESHLAWGEANLCSFWSRSAAVPRTWSRWLTLARGHLSLSPSEGPFAHRWRDTLTAGARRLRPRAQSRWQEHAASGDVFFWLRRLMNTRILSGYFCSTPRTFTWTDF